MIDTLTLINGDCIETMKSIQNEFIDLIVTDPPYLINYKTGWRTNKTHDFCSTIQNDDNFYLIDNYIKECYRILKNDTAMYMFCNSTHVDYFKQTLEKHGFVIKNLIVWVKNNWTSGDLTCAFGKQYEFIFLVNKGTRQFNGNRLSDVWEFSRIVGKQQLHQNQKPVKLLKQCIIKHSNENDLVFDGFMGVGSTGVACAKLNRRFYGIEIKKRYFDLAKSRIDIFVEEK